MKQWNQVFVKEKDNGVRLDLFLVSAALVETRALAQEAILAGSVQLDGEVMLRPAIRLKPGMFIEFALPDGADATKRPERTKKIVIEATPEPKVLEENAFFVVLNKPAGLAMHPAGRSHKLTLTDWIKERYPQVIGIGEDESRPGMVHRLDQDTSGIVLIAKSQTVFKGLKRLFHDRLIEKTYFALVYGTLDQPSGVVKLPLGRIKGTAKRGVPEGKREFAGELREAETEYSLRTRYPQYDFLSVKPKTGRTHQIRVHLATLGHPIVGDRLYRFKEHRRDPLQPPFQLLHAGEIRFTLGKRKYSFQAPLPSYFADTLKVLDAEAGRRYDWSA